MSRDVVATLVLPDDRNDPDGEPPRPPSRHRLLVGLLIVAGLLAAAALARPHTRDDRDAVPDPDALRGRPAVALRGENVTPLGNGSFEVDLVNAGARAVVVVARLGSLAGRVRILGEPQLPVSLEPDQRARVRFMIVLPACPGPGPAAVAEQLGLEARSSVGWSLAQGTPGSELNRAFSAAATAASAAQCGR